MAQSRFGPSFSRNRCLMLSLVVSWLLAVFQYSQLHRHQHALSNSLPHARGAGGRGNEASPDRMRSNHMRERDQLRARDRQVISDIAAGHMAGLNTSHSSFYGGHLSAQMRRTRHERWKLTNPDKIVHSREVPWKPDVLPGLLTPGGPGVDGATQQNLLREAKKRKAEAMAAAAVEGSKAWEEKIGKVDGSKPETLGEYREGLVAGRPTAKTMGYYFSVAALYKGEEDYIVEWIEYHLLMGVQHFFLFSNEGCIEDNLLGREKLRSQILLQPTRPYLAPYVNAGVVTINDFYCEVEEDLFKAAAYKMALDMYGPATQWLAFLDVKEFIVIRQESSKPGQKRKKEKNKKPPARPSIGQIFASMGGGKAGGIDGKPGWGGVVLPWRVFGTSNHVYHPDGPVTGSYVSRASTENAEDFRARSFKTVVNTKGCTTPSVHVCLEFEHGWDKYSRTPIGDAVRPGRSELNSKLRARLHGYKDLYLAYYRTKSEEDWRTSNIKKMGSMLNEQSINYVYSQGEGAPPEEYNKVLDRSVVQTVVERLELLLQYCPLDAKVPNTGNTVSQLLSSLSDVLIGANVSLPIKKSDFLTQWVIKARKLGPGVPKPSISDAIEFRHSLDGCLVCQLMNVCEDKVFGPVKLPKGSGGAHKNTKAENAEKIVSMLKKLKVD